MEPSSRSKSADAKPTRIQSDLVGCTKQTRIKRRDLELRLDITPFRNGVSSSKALS